MDRRAGNVLAQARELCEPVLRNAVGALPEPLRRMAGYHFGWWDTSGMPSRAAAGKALRPALAIGTAVACGGHPSVAVHCAAGIELIHNFTLIHDDVMDADTSRRGRATVWSVWGIPNAILVGDVMHAMAGQALLAGLPKTTAVDASTRLATAVVEMCRGQYEDCAFETRGQVDVEEYTRMAMGKTGALMGCACALGALCAGADEATISRMDGFGRELGLAFQFTDDIIGIWGDPALTGKPVGNDLARRKRSLPVVAALASRTEAAVALADLYRSETPMSATDVADAATLIDISGARQWAKDQADRRVQSAIDALPDPTQAADLLSLAGMVARRDR